jgi:hypothetical protein
MCFHCPKFSRRKKVHSIIPANSSAFILLDQGHLTNRLTRYSNSAKEKILPSTLGYAEGLYINEPDKKDSEDPSSKRETVTSGRQTKFIGV